MTSIDSHQVVGCYVVIGLLMLYVALVPLMRPRRSTGAKTAAVQTISIGRQVILFAGMAFLAVGVHALLKGY